jgi:hypothetical protein
VVAFDNQPKFLPVLETRRPHNMTAFVGDALLANQDPNFTATASKYNLIVGANLIDRLSDPALWINHCKDLLEEDGLLILFSPFTWMREYTEENHWLGKWLA